MSSKSTFFIFFSVSDDSIQIRLDTLQSELAELRQRIQQHKNEMVKVENVTLIQRLKDTHDSLISQEMQKEEEVSLLLETQNSYK